MTHVLVRTGEFLVMFKNGRKCVFANFPLFYWPHLGNGPMIPIPEGGFQDIPNVPDEDYDHHLGQSRLG